MQDSVELFEFVCLVFIDINPFQPERKKKKPLKVTGSDSMVVPVVRAKDVAVLV